MAAPRRFSLGKAGFGPLPKAPRRALQAVTVAGVVAGAVQLGAYVRTTKPE